MEPPKKGLSTPADIQTTNGVVRVPNPHEEYYNILPMISEMLRCEACKSTESNFLTDAFTAPCQHTVCGKCKTDLVINGVFYCPNQCRIDGMREDPSLLQRLCALVRDRMPYAHMPCAVFDQNQLSLNKRFEHLRERVFRFVQKSCNNKMRSRIVTVKVPATDFDDLVIKLFIYEMTKLRAAQMEIPDKRAVMTQPQAYATYKEELPRDGADGPKFIVVDLSTVHELMGSNETISTAVAGQGSDISSDGVSVRSNSSTRTVGLGMLSRERKKSVLMAKASLRSDGAEQQPTPEKQEHKRRAVAAKASNGGWVPPEPVFSEGTLAEVDGASPYAIP